MTPEGRFFFNRFHRSQPVVALFWRRGVSPLWPQASVHVSELCVYHLASKEADAEAGIQAVQSQPSKNASAKWGGIGAIQKEPWGFFPEKMWQNSDLGTIS